MVYDRYYLKNGSDELNRKKIRNMRNTEKEVYNCAGYALGTFSWYCPQHDGYPVGYLFRTLEQCINIMLHDFPDMRVIDNVSELQEGEYAIAFRMSTSDFHYVRRTCSGQWRHKMGGHFKIEYMKEETVFSKSWGHGYDGEMVLFAKRF